MSSEQLEVESKTEVDSLITQWMGPHIGGDKITRLEAASRFAQARANDLRAARSQPPSPRVVSDEDVRAWADRHDLPSGGSHLTDARCAFEDAASFAPAQQLEKHRASMQFTLPQAEALLDFFGGSNAYMTVEFFPKAHLKDEPDAPDGLYVFSTDYPEEGAQWLGEENSSDEIEPTWASLVLMEEQTAQPSVPVETLRVLSDAATPGKWRVMREGNQLIETRHLPTAKVVGASRIDGPKRPWNPHASIAFGTKAEQHETVRFIDADADFVCALVNWFREFSDQQLIAAHDGKAS